MEEEERVGNGKGERWVGGKVGEGKREGCMGKGEG